MSTWIVERVTWRPRLRRWDVRFLQQRHALGGGWYRLPKYATKYDEVQARAIAGHLLEHTRAVPLVVVLGRGG